MRCQLTRGDSDACLHNSVAGHTGGGITPVPHCQHQAASQQQRSHSLQGQPATVAALVERGRHAHQTRVAQWRQGTLLMIGWLVQASARAAAAHHIEVGSCLHHAVHEHDRIVQHHLGPPQLLVQRGSQGHAVGAVCLLRQAGS